MGILCFQKMFIQYHLFICVCRLHICTEIVAQGMKQFQGWYEALSTTHRNGIRGQGFQGLEPRSHQRISTAGVKLDVWWERVRVGGTWLVLLHGRVAQPNALWKGSMGQALNPKRFQRPTGCMMFRSETRRGILEILCVCKFHIRKSQWCQGKFQWCTLPKSKLVGRKGKHPKVNWVWLISCFRDYHVSQFRVPKY